MTDVKTLRRVITWLFALIMLLAAPRLAVGQELDFSALEGASGGGISLRTIQIIVLITVLSLAPAILMMVTCFPFVITVFAILRQALGLQQSPPNMMLVSLGIFVTYFVMEPVFNQAWDAGVVPMLNETLDPGQAAGEIVAPFQKFMTARVDPEVVDELIGLRSDIPPETQMSELPLSVMVPSFMLSELSRAFQVGFLIFLPFLIIDLVVAAVLMSMGMMMVPPALVSLPFKLGFFVVADGWGLIVTSLVRSYQ